MHACRSTLEDPTLERANGHLVAKAARFLSDCTIEAFHGKLTKQQYAIFELALAMADVETAVALCEAAARNGGELMLAQARVRAAEIAVSVPARLLRLFAGSGLFDAEKVAELGENAGLAGAFTAQSGTLADMDFIAKSITA